MHEFPYSQYWQHVKNLYQPFLKELKVKKSKTQKTKVSVAVVSVERAWEKGRQVAPTVMSCRVVGHCASDTSLTRLGRDPCACCSSSFGLQRWLHWLCCFLRAPSSPSPHVPPRGSSAPRQRSSVVSVAWAVVNGSRCLFPLRKFWPASRAIAMETDRKDHWMEPLFLLSLPSPFPHPEAEAGRGFLQPGCLCRSMQIW